MEGRVAVNPEQGHVYPCGLLVSARGLLEQPPGGRCVDGHTRNVGYRSRFPIVNNLTHRGY